MMRRASSLCGLAALILALAGPGAGRAVFAQDAPNQPGHQLAVSVGVPAEFTEDREVAPADGGGPLESKSATDAPAVHPPQPAGAPVAVLQSWSFGSEDQSSAEATPFLLDLPPEPQTSSVDPDSTYEPPAGRSAEPHDFRINDRLKVKVQPMGGGLGGRATLTFSFQTGY